MDFEKLIKCTFAYTFYICYSFTQLTKKYYFAWKKKSTLVFHEFLVKLILQLQTGNSKWKDPVSTGQALEKRDANEYDTWRGGGPQCWDARGSRGVPTTEGEVGTL